MGGFSEAVRQMQQDEAKCPQCGAKNERGKPPTIRIDVHREAWCSKCGKEWSVPQ